MNILIVFAHPEPKSFNGEALRFAQQTLLEEGHSVEISDLYAMEFNPVSSRENFMERKNPEFLKLQEEELYAAQTNTFAPDIKVEMEKVLGADCIIFQFPLWWFSLPAILKGWFDRVFAMGFAYGGGRVYSSGIFKGKRAILSVTTGGSEESYRAGGANGDINMILYPIQHGILYFAGMDVLPPFFVWSPARLKQVAQEQYFEEFHQRLLTLFTTPPLKWK